MKNGLVFERGISYNIEDPAEGGYAGVVMDIIEQEVEENISPLLLKITRFEEPIDSTYHKEILRVRLVDNAMEHPLYNAVLDFLINRGFSRVRGK